MRRWQRMAYSSRNRRRFWPATGYAAAQRSEQCTQSVWVEKIPTDQQIRNLRDPIEPKYMGAPFWRVLARLQQDRVLHERWIYRFAQHVPMRAGASPRYVNCHTVLQLCDIRYQRLRSELGARCTFFDDIRTLTRYLFFPSWSRLLTFMIT